MKKTEVHYYSDEIIIVKKNIVERIEYNLISHIIYDRPYTNIVTTCKKKYLIFLSLIELTKNIPNFFFQCNKYSIVNMKFIQSVKKGKKQTSHIIMKDNEIISLSERKYVLLLERLLKMKAEVD